MCWTNLNRGIGFLALTGSLTTLFLLSSPAAGNSNAVIPFSNMNKTIRDEFRKHRFLDQVLGKIKASVRNLTSNNSPPRAVISPRSQDTHSSDTPPHRQLDNISQTDRQQPDSPIAFRDYAVSLALPNVIYSETIEKDVLTFKFKSNVVRNNTRVNRIYLWLYFWTQEHKSKTSGTSSPPKTRDLNGDDYQDKPMKGKKVKIRVFLSDTNGSRGQRIAELTTRIKSSTWGKLGLPVSLMNALAETDTLRLKVECKRCTRKVQLILPGNNGSKSCRQLQRMKKRKKKEKRVRRMRKNCASVDNTNEKLFPFIVLEEKSKFNHNRFKRAAVIDLDTSKKKGIGCIKCTKSNKRNVFDAGISQNINTSVKQSCVSVATYVDFADLNLDYVVVYPSGFEYVTCIGSCSDTPVLLPGNTKRILKRVIRSASKEILNHQKKVHGHSSHTNETYVSNYTNHRHITQHRLHIQHNRFRTMKQGHWDKFRRRMVSTSQHGCQPVETRNLVILYFTHEHNLAHLELPGFLVTQCGCNNHLPHMKV